MVGDALEGNRQIGMALLQPGWGSTQDQSPKVFNVGGMGLITQHEHLEEGRYNILLSGRHRYRIVEFVRETLLGGPGRALAGGDAKQPGDE